MNLQTALSESNDRTKTVKQWLKQLPDSDKQFFAINWRMPHTIFNCTCKYCKAEHLQNIDWYQIYKSRDLGSWSHGGGVGCI